MFFPSMTSQNVCCKKRVKWLKSHLINEQTNLTKSVESQWFHIIWCNYLLQMKGEKYFEENPMTFSPLYSAADILCAWLRLMDTFIISIVFCMHNPLIIHSNSEPSHTSSSSQLSRVLTHIMHLTHNCFSVHFPSWPDSSINCSVLHPLYSEQGSFKCVFK